MGATKDLHIQMQDELFNTVSQVDNGELGYLEGLIRLRKEKEMLKTSIEIIDEFESTRMSQIEDEASKYPDGYHGNEIKVVSGRKLYSFKGISEVEEAEKQKKAAEDKYKAAFDGFQKGVVQTTRLNEKDPESPLGWIDEDGQVLPFPELNIGKSYITVKQIKPIK